MATLGVEIDISEYVETLLEIVTLWGDGAHVPKHLKATLNEMRESGLDVTVYKGRLIPSSKMIAMLANLRALQAAEARA